MSTSAALAATDLPVVDRRSLPQLLNWSRLDGWLGSSLQYWIRWLGLSSAGTYLVRLTPCRMACTNGVSGFCSADRDCHLGALLRPSGRAASGWDCGRSSAVRVLNLGLPDQCYLACGGVATSIAPIAPNGAVPTTCTLLCNGVALPAGDLLQRLELNARVSLAAMVLLSAGSANTEWAPGAALGPVTATRRLRPDCCCWLHIYGVRGDMVDTGIYLVAAVVGPCLACQLTVSL
jgi:hypothetical protein